MDSDDRMKYYLGDFYNKEVILEKNNLKDKNLNLINLEEFIKGKKYKHFEYFEYIKCLLKKNNIDKYILFLAGDYNNNINKLPLLCKTRRENNNNIIINFTRFRHMNLVDYLVKFPDIPFNLKKNIVIWRGSTTGNIKNTANRFLIVEKFYNYNINKINIGFSSNKIINNKEQVGITKKNIKKKFVKEALTINQLLQNKFLVSVEGNELSSGLKWMLYSNSVVLMAKPRNFSWIMEDKLIPNKHYILLKDDFSDLEEKYKWCKQNLKKCNKISINATEYMKQFLDINKEKELENMVIKRYVKNITIK